MFGGDANCPYTRIDGLALLLGTRRLQDRRAQLNEGRGDA